MAIYFHFSVLIRTFAVTVISVVKFLITCLIFEISKAKTFKDASHPPSWIFKNIIASQQVNFFSLKKELANMFNVKIRLDLYEYTKLRLFTLNK